VELGPKRLELVHELVPSASVGLLVNPSSRNAQVLSQEVQTAAPPLGIKIHVLHANSEHEFESIFASPAQLRVGALVIGSDPLYNAHSEQLAALTVRHALPAIYQYREFARVGGLMSLRGSCDGAVPSSGHLHRPDTQGREASRLSYNPQKWS
jgi:putative ABC transport system substrate-binding protein